MTVLAPLVKKYSIMHIVGREYRIRYSLNALLCLEMTYKPIDEIIKNNVANWTIEDVLQLARAALSDLPENKSATVNRDWDSILPNVFNADIQPQDLKLLKTEILNAISDSFPKSVVGQKNVDDGKGIDGIRLRAIYVDILHRNEKDFWTSTLAEISERIEAYFDVKGYDSNVEHVQEFDDEGM